MSPNKRIFLNIMATYGRTLLGVLCGIFSMRWVLMALGHEDFGLFGLVGSIVIFLSFFNTQFAGALSRFYAYSVGQAKVSKDPDKSLEECRKWFSTGVTIHTVVPAFLVAVGYPIGVWAISNGIIGVPTGKIEACIWLWRFVCASSFVSMLSVPFSAMYTAKQYIAELTIYSVVQVILRTAFIYYMTLKPGNWLVRYGFVMNAIIIVPQLLICARAVFVFPECRLRMSYMGLWPYIRRIGEYAGWQTFGGLGYIARHQFLTIVVNRFFGPKITASFSIGGTVGGEAAALTGALQGAFAPAITTACGERDFERVKLMSYQACKFGTLLTLLFAIPMGLEISELLRVWLKEVPNYAEGICLIMLAVIVIEKLTIGHIIGVNASGNVALFQFCKGVVSLTAIPFSIGLALFSQHVYAVGIALLMTTILSCCSDIWLARTRIGLSIRYFIFKIFVPLAMVTSISCTSGFLIRFVIDSCILRMAITSIISTSVSLLLSWRILLNGTEKEFVRAKLLNFLKNAIDRFIAQEYKK